MARLTQPSKEENNLKANRGIVRSDGRDRLGESATPAALPLVCDFASSGQGDNRDGQSIVVRFKTNPFSVF